MSETLAVFRVLGLIAVVIGGFGVLAFISMLASREVNEVNAILPEEERFADFVWTPGKCLAMGRAYRRLHPKRVVRPSTVAGSVLVLAAITGFLWLA